MKNFISILTASYNRGRYLKKLYKSLLIQKFEKFEWIIADDGSTDNTEEIIKKFIEEKKIKIIYIKSNIRIGKVVLDNVLLKKAGGKFIIHCDSDDYFAKNTFNFFSKTFILNKNQFNKDVIGILTQNLSTEGISQTYENNKFPNEKKIYSYENAKEFIKGDATIFVKKSCFINTKFPEIDFVSNESVLLDGLYKNKKFIMSKKVTKIMNRTANLSVSFGNKLSYCRGSLYSIIKSINQKKFDSFNFFKQMKLIINYSRYSIHSDFNYIKSKNKWVVSKYNSFYFIYYIFGKLITIRDHILGKIEKTHLEFDQNKKKYKLTELYNYQKL